MCSHRRCSAVTESPTLSWPLTADRQVRAAADGGAAEDAVDVDVDARARHDLHHPHRRLAGIERLDDLRGRQPLDLADDHGVGLGAHQPAAALLGIDLVARDQQRRHGDVDLGGVGRAFADRRAEHRRVDVDARADMQVRDPDGRAAFVERLVHLRRRQRRRGGIHQHAGAGRAPLAAQLLDRRDRGAADQRRHEEVVGAVDRRFGQAEFGTPSARIFTRAPITRPLSTTVVLPAQSGGTTLATGTGVLSCTMTGAASALLSLQVPRSSCRALIVSPRLSGGFTQTTARRGRSRPAGSGRRCASA